MLSVIAGHGLYMMINMLSLKAGSLEVERKTPRLLQSSMVPARLQVQNWGKGGGGVTTNGLMDTQIYSA
jgi:hypothetical protein